MFVRSGTPDRLSDQIRFSSRLTEWGIDATFVPGASMNYPRGSQVGWWVRGQRRVCGPGHPRRLRALGRHRGRRVVVAAHAPRPLPLGSRPGLRRRVPRHAGPGPSRALASRRAVADAARLPRGGQRAWHPLGRGLERAGHIGHRGDPYEPARRHSHVDRADLPATCPRPREPHDLAGHRSAPRRARRAAGPPASSSCATDNCSRFEASA